MSGAIGSATGEFGPYGGGLAGVLLSDGRNVRQQLDRVTEQAADGLISDNYAGLGSGASVALSVAPQIAAQKAWQNDIGAATAQMDVAQTALTQINSVASTFLAATNNLNGLSTQEVDSIAANAQQALRQVAGLLDTTDGGIYVFGGQDSSEPPVPDPDGILGSGFYAHVQAAVQGLAANGSAAVIATTLAVASSNANAISPFNPTLSQSAAALAGFQPQAAIGPGQQATIGILASTNGFVASTGTSTTGSYMRDILRALATLGSLSSAQVNVSGFASVVADTRTSLSDAITALNQDAGVLGNTESSLKTQADTLSGTTTALQTQLSNAQDVDMTQTISQLSQTQARLQASYELISGIQTYSLAKLLGTG
jgi:flagellin-like hook-associated protein FlgL